MIKDVVFKTGITYQYKYGNSIFVSAYLITEILPMDDNIVKVKLFYPSEKNRITYYFKRGEKFIVAPSNGFPGDLTSIWFYTPWSNNIRTEHALYNAELVSFDYNQIVLRCDFSEKVTVSKDSFFEKDKAYQVRIRDIYSSYYIIELVEFNENFNKEFNAFILKQDKQMEEFEEDQIITAYYSGVKPDFGFEFYTEYQYKKEKEKEVGTEK